MSLQINPRADSNWTDRNWIPHVLAKQWLWKQEQTSLLANEIRSALQKYDQTIPRERYFLSGLLRKKVPIVDVLYNIPMLLANPFLSNAMAHQKYVQLDYIAECATKSVWTHRTQLPNLIEKDLQYKQKRKTKQGLSKHYIFCNNSLFFLYSVC